MSRQKSHNGYFVPGVSYLPLFLIVILGIMTACEDTFTPLETNDQYAFSIFGYLDATAESQWIRVMPVREKIDRYPNRIDATVTLEHLGSGDSVVLSDSLFEFGQNGRVWNFWTTMEIKPDESYRLTAENSDGWSSTVLIEVPGDFQTPLYRSITRRVGFSNFVDLDQILISGVERLVDVKSIWEIERIIRAGGATIPIGAVDIFTFSHLFAVEEMEPGFFVAEIDQSRDLDHIRARYNRPNSLTDEFQVNHRQIFVAASGTDYPDFDGLEELVRSLPDMISNVDNGLGFVPGIVSKTIPAKSCFDDQNIHVPCPLETPRWE